MIKIFLIAFVFVIPFSAYPARTAGSKEIIRRFLNAIEYGDSAVFYQISIEDSLSSNRIYYENSVDNLSIWTLVRLHYGVLIYRQKKSPNNHQKSKLKIDFIKLPTATDIGEYIVSWRRNEANSKVIYLRMRRVNSNWKIVEVNALFY